MSTPDRSVGFIDLDGTAVDLVGGLARAHGKPLTRATWPLTYDLSVALGMPMAQVWQHPSVLGAAFWEALEPLPWAHELVEVARHYFHEIAFLSQGVRDPASFTGKVAWAQRHFPGVPCIVGTDKKVIARSGHTLIDDYEKNEEEWTKRGGSFVLIPGPWNRLHAMPDGEVISHVHGQLGRCVGAPLSVRAAAVYTRPECPYSYCSAPDECRPKGKCRFHAG